MTFLDILIIKKQSRSFHPTIIIYLPARPTVLPFTLRGKLNRPRPPVNIILLFVVAMQQKSEFSCSCVGGLFNPQEKFFLVRKKENEEADPPILRRGNKSTEVKNESEGKPQKKSLKKRPLSNHSAETSTPVTPTQPPKPEELRIAFDPDDPQFSFSRAEVHAHSASFMPYFPAPTTPAETSHRQKSYNQYADHKNSHPQPLPQFFPVPSRTLLLQNTPRHVSNSPHQIQPAHRQHPIAQSLPECLPVQQHVQPQAKNPQLPFRQERQSWSMPRDESLLIEDFDRLFNHDDSRIEDKPMRVRDVQRSRRFEKQQLIGRLAESDDDACSDPASEVIGKGFDSHFQQDFWEEQEQDKHAKQTYASRSTNTKLSELQRVNDNLDPHSPAYPHQRNRFGTFANYKSYKFL